MTLRISYTQSKLPDSLKKLVKQVPDIIEAEQNRISRQVADELLNLTKSWAEKPKFKITKIRQGFQISTTSSVFIWLDQGTKAHKIPGTPYPTTWVGGKYKAATRPGSMTSGTHVTSNPAYVTPLKGVIHPGTEARGWTDLLEKKYNPLMQKKVKDALRDASKDL